MYFGIVFILVVSVEVVTLPIFENTLYGQSPNSNYTNSPLTDRSPAFLEAYWTGNSQSITSSSDNNNDNNGNNLVKEEVGPSEGASTLAVVLVNKGRSDITGLTGFLALPTGFKSIEGENLVTLPNVAVASYNSIVKPGQSFTLFFIIDVLENAKIGAYYGSLDLLYSKVLETDQLKTKITVPFRVTGKVVLDAVSMDKSLVAGSPNELKILLKNDGTADANGVTVTVKDVTEGTTTAADASTSSSTALSNAETSIETNATSTDNNEGEGESASSQIVNVQAKTFTIGKIPAKSSVIINPIVYPRYTSGGSVQSLGMEMLYNDAYGNRRSSDLSVGLVIAPNPPESVLNISPIKTDNNNNIASLSKNIASNENATPVTGNNENNTTFSKPLDTSSPSSISLVAGKIENVNLLVTTSGNLTLNNLVLSLDSQSDSVKILGKSKWAVKSLGPLSQLQLSTMIYAGESAIGNPIQLKMDADYISGGQSKSDLANLGLYVEGQIKVRLYDLDINNIGNTPNLVGNLLNEGNTVALFTNIAIVGNNNNKDNLNNWVNNSNKESSNSYGPISNVSSNSNSSNSNSSISNNSQQERPDQIVTQLPPSQYLGDLSENSPLPFSIPLEIGKGVPKGVYPITVKVTYNDNLRNTHTLLLNGTVNYTPQQTESSSETKGYFGLDTQSPSIIIPAVSLTGILVLIFIMSRRRRRRRKAMRNKDFGSNSFANKNGEGFELFDK